MNKSLFVLLVLAAALIFVQADEPNKCDVYCWISKLNITINKPLEFQASVPIPIIGDFALTGTITNMTINNIRIADIVSIYPAPKVDVNESFYIKVVVETAHAHGKWAGDSSAGKCSGSASIDLKNVQIALTMIFHKNQTDGLIERVEVPDGDDNDYCYIYMDIEKMELTFDRTEGFIDAIQKFLKFFGSSIEKLAAKLVDSSIMDTVKQKLPSFVCPMLQPIIEDNLTSLFHQANDMIREYQAKGDPLEIPVYEEMVDLHISPIVDTARFLFGRFIGVDGPFNLSYIVDIFSKGTGVLTLKDLYDEDLEFTFDIDSLNASLTLGIDDVILEGLKTWRDFRLLEPNDTSNVTLDSHTDLEMLAITLKWHIKVKVDGDMISTGGATLSENATFYVKLVENVLNVSIQLASYDNLAQNYSNADCMNTTCMEALISPDSTGITYFFINMTFENITLSADSGDLEEDIRHLINTVVGMFVDNYYKAIPSFVNGIVMTFLPQINDLLQGLLADAFCDGVPDEEVIEVDVPVTVGSVGGASVLTALLMVLPCSGLIMKKKRVADEDEDAKDGAEMSDLATTYVEGQTPKKTDKDDKYLFKGLKCGNKTLRQFLRVDVEGASMFFDPRLSLATRVIIPLLLFCTIAIFLSANTGVGASVFVVMTFGKYREVTLPSLFDFGLINTVEDMWTAGVYPLAILVAFFSGIWPYLKVVIMIVAWFLPKKIFCEKSRGTLFEWLDILGKWSLLDSYVMIMMLVAFHFDIPFPIVNSRDISKPTDIQIFVYPAYGFLALIIGTLVSLLMSHVLLALHRYIQPDDHMNECDDAQRARPLFLYAAAGQSGIVRLITRVGLTVGLAFSMIMMILGTALETFSFDFVGLVGWLLPMLDIPAHRAYSVLSLTVEVPPSAQEPNSFTVRFTQVIFILTAFIVPVLHIASMLILWLVPLKRKVQHYIMYACEVLSAWSCVDVFIISIIAACLQIEQFAGFMVGDKCDFLIPYLEEFLADFVGEYLSCFTVIATLESGCYVLFIGTIVHTAVYMTFNRVVEAALRTRGNNGVAMTKEQVKEYLDRGKNKKKDKKGKKGKDEKEKEPQKTEEMNTTNAFGNVTTSNKSFVASVSTLSIAATPNEGSYDEEVEEDERTDSSVDDLEAPPPVAPLPPSVDTTV